MNPTKHPDQNKDLASNQNFTKSNKEIDEEIAQLEKETTNEHLAKIRKVEDLKIEKYQRAKAKHDQDQSAFIRLDQKRNQMANTRIDIQLTLCDANGQAIEKVVIQGGIDRDEVNNLTAQIYSKTGLLNTAVSRIKEHHLNLEHAEAIKILDNRRRNQR